MHDPPLPLIVDDDHDNRATLNTWLVSQNYATAQSCGGEEAIDAFRRLSPDLILLDVMKPKLDGFELTRFWWANENLSLLYAIRRHRSRC